MTVQIKKLNNSNLLDLSKWTPGQGDVDGFSLNGLYSESNRIYDTGPYGQSVLVWGTYPSGDNGADGGWNGSNVAIDNTKTYRYSVWMRRTSSSSGGTSYMGLYTNGTGNGATALHDGINQTNPYWDYRGTSWWNQNQWYLLVGHIQPASTAINSPPMADSGVWTKKGGKVSPLFGNIQWDCKFPSDATMASMRVYHFYCGDSTTRMQFYSPRIDLVDGNQPTIEHLLNIDLTNPSIKPEAIVYNDGTAQANSGNTSFKDHGELISVSSYTNGGSYTWTKPTNCTRVLVKVTGGGGGAAGYCESGGAGGYAEKLINVENLNQVTVTVGGGGSNTGYYAAAGDGGTSSFGSYVSASGGYGANRNISHTGGYAGGGSGGDINLYGGGGTGHSNSHSHCAVARGGGGYFGGPCGLNRTAAGSRIGQGAPGNGGAGGRTDENWAGSVGQAGCVIIWEYR